MAPVLDLNTGINRQADDLFVKIKFLSSNYICSDVKTSVQLWHNSSQENLLDLECVPGVSHGSWDISGLLSTETENLKIFVDAQELNLLRKWNCTQIYDLFAFKVLTFQFRFSNFRHRRLCKIFVTCTHSGREWRFRPLPIVNSSKAGCSDLAHGTRTLDR